MNLQVRPLHRMKPAPRDYAGCSMDEDLTGLVVSEARDHMARAVEHTRAEFGTIRTGRASPALVEHVKVDYYGTETELRQIAGFSVPEARLLVVAPYDKGALGAIEKALQSSDLGITPSNDGAVIRLNFPVPTEQRRKELVKMVRHKAEEGKVSVRNVRRAARQDLESMQKDGDISTDQLKGVEKDLERCTQDQVAAIDKLLVHKEQELLEI